MFIVTGLFVLNALIAFTIFTIKTVKKQGSLENQNVEKEHVEGELFLSRYKIETLPKAFALVGLGIVLLFLGGHFTVDGEVAIADSLGLSQLVIGVVIVGIGTSLPELITSVIAIARKQTDIGVGNIVGSNIYNILLILGIAATIVGIPVSADAFTSYYIMIAFSLVLFVGFRKYIPRPIGFGLVGAFAIYLGSLVLR